MVLWRCMGVDLLFRVSIVFKVLVYFYTSMKMLIYPGAHVSIRRKKQKRAPSNTLVLAVRR